VREAGPDPAVGVRVVVAAEQLTARRQGGGNPSGQHQGPGPFGHEPVTSLVGLRHQPDRPAEQAGRDIGGGHGGLAGGPGQPPDGLGVPPARLAGQVLRHLGGGRSGRGEPLPGLAVQRPAHASGQVLVDRVADQVVAEPKPGPVVLEHPGPERLGQLHRQVRRRTAGDLRQVGEREAGPQDRGEPERLQRALGQEADPAQDRQPQRRRQRRGRVGHLGLAAGDRDHLLTGQRPEQLGHEQRVARRARYPGLQPSAGRGADGVGDQFRHRPPVQLAQGQVPASGCFQAAGQPLQAGHGRGRAEAPDDRRGQAVQPGRQRAQGH
jgi:hypothetical protein